MKFEKFLNKYRIETRVKDDIEYRQVTISQHTGVRFRGTKLGSKIGRKRQFIVDLDEYPNTVMFTRQGLKDGAIGFAPIEVNKCIVTENMPTLSVNTEIVDIDYLQRLLNSNYFLKKINELSIVGSAQKSIHERDLLKLEVDIPSIDTQKEIAKRIISKEVNYNSLINEIQTQKQLIAKLKQAILQEAIQGKLTQDWRKQNPNTESAKELLERIKAEKKQLIKDKKIRKEKALPPITEEEIPFEIPESWVWVNLREITAIKGGKRVSNGYQLLKKKTPYIYIRVSDMKNGTISENDLHYLDEGMYQKIKNYTIEKTDIYMTIVGGTIGKCGVVPEKFHKMNLTENAAKITPILSNKLYLLKCLESNFCQNQFLKKTKQVAVQKMSLTRFGLTILPLPPLEEQKAIVQKVKTLMQKCDALEQEITQSEKHANMLMQAVLKEAFENDSA